MYFKSIKSTSKIMDDIDNIGTDLTKRVSYSQDEIGEVDL